MKTTKENQETLYYSVVKSAEAKDGKIIFNYGIKCVSSNRLVSISALSYDYDKIKALTDRLNEASLSIDCFREIIGGVYF